MSILRSVKRNPWTTVLAVITFATGAWEMLADNAELFGFSAKAIAIVSLLLTIAMMAYNQFSSQE